MQNKLDFLATYLRLFKRNKDLDLDINCLYKCTHIYILIRIRAIYITIFNNYYNLVYEKKSVFVAILPLRFLFHYEKKKRCKINYKLNSSKFSLILKDI